MAIPQIDVILPLVSRIMQIDDSTSGDSPHLYHQHAQLGGQESSATEPSAPESAKSKFLYRFRGHLLSEDSGAAYDELSENLNPLGVTPLFRNEEDRHAIYIIAGVDDPKPSNPLINVVLFALTVVSVMLFGAVYGYEGPIPQTFMGLIYTAITNIWRGWPFAVSLLSILLAHEFGHYFASRFHKSAASLPYFIPLPFIGFGTMGAVIILKQRIKNRRILMDIGLAGPLAGLVVAIPVLIYGLATSPLGVVPQASNLEGNSLLYLFLKFIVHGQLLPAPVDYGNVAPFIYWAKFYFTTTPVPVGGLDVQLNQVAWAGWVGLLVTAMNLIPVGQLDGGHIGTALFGKKFSKTFFVFIAIFGLLGFVWHGWWFWVALLLVIGRAYDAPLDQITPLGTPRRIMGIIGLIIFFLVLIPAPLPM